MSQKKAMNLEIIKEKWLDRSAMRDFFKQFGIIYDLNHLGEYMPDYPQFNFNFGLMVMAEDKKVK